MTKLDRSPPDGDEPAVVAGLHAREIAGRHFPRSKKGLDPDAVRSWLDVVGRAYETLEQEVESLRTQRDRFAASLRASRDRGPVASVRAILRQTKLRRSLAGYSRESVDSLLEAAAAELTRLETRCALLEAELDAMRFSPGDALDARIARLESELKNLRQDDGQPPSTGAITLPFKEAR